MPAILDGRYPYGGPEPLAADHPHSLFTFLGGEMKVVNDELLTQLCPERLCPAKSSGGGWFATAKGLTSDLSVIAAHAVLPEDPDEGAAGHRRDLG